MTLIRANVPLIFAPLVETGPNETALTSACGLICTLLLKVLLVKLAALLHFHLPLMSFLILS